MYAAPLTNRRVIQTAYVVNDLEAAARGFTAALGIGPFFIVNRPTISGATYRGRPAQVEFSTAITQAGDIQLELVQQHCDSPSCYRDMFGEGQEGFHHIAVFAGDYDAEIARYRTLDIDIAATGRVGPMRFCYMDTSQHIFAMTEVLESVPFILEYFRNLRETCETWDGSRPVRDASELL
ncbi:MAG: VOC family protein [Hyphomonadaceae bacterium]|nr:VOC family protein [Hyphomonadaceae bacterium]